MDTTDTSEAPEPETRRPGRVWRAVGTVVLAFVALLGAVLSWGNLYRAAETAIGDLSPAIHGVNVYAAAFPFLLDALILGCSLMYVGGVKAERPAAGWRVIAHAGIAATIAFNAAASTTIGRGPWHVVAPAVWAVIVELYARDALREMREVRHDVDADRIPLRLWLSAPAESVRTSWRMARTGERSADAARVAADGCAAARDALYRTLPDRSDRMVRRQVTRRLWAGSIPPEDVFAACGWTAGQDRSSEPTADEVLRVALRRLMPPPVTPDDPVGLPSVYPVSDGQMSPDPTGQTPACDRADDRSADPTVTGPKQAIRRAAKPVTPQVPAGQDRAGLTPSAITVLTYLLDRGPVPRRDIIRDLGMKETTAKMALTALAKQDRIKRVGDGVYQSIDPVSDPRSDRSDDHGHDRVTGTEVTGS